MKIMTGQETFAMLCKERRCWGLYLSYGSPEDWWDITLAVPFLTAPKYGQAMVDGQAFILCDSEEECQQLYDQVVGDDGPTKINPYNGPIRAYALTVSPDGEFMNENT